MTWTFPSYLPVPWPDGKEKWGLHSAKGFAYLNVFAEGLPRAVGLNIFVCAGLLGIH